MKTYNEFIAEASLARKAVSWWNRGRNVRVPDENNASWKALLDDDRRQLTRTDSAFKSGATGLKGWRPLKAFTPTMVKTGPTPAVRQAFERPVRAVLKPFSRLAGTSGTVNNNLLPNESDKNPLMSRDKRRYEGPTGLSGIKPAD